MGWELLQATIAGYSRHPNFGGLIVIGLGCEVNQVSGMAQSMDWASSDTFKMMTIQEVGGTRKTIQEGVEMIKQMLPILNKNKREKSPIKQTSFRFRMWWFGCLFWYDSKSSIRLCS